MKPTVIVLGFSRAEAEQLKEELKEVVISSFRITSAFRRTSYSLDRIAREPPTCYGPMKRKIMVFINFSPKNRYRVHRYYSHLGRTDLFWLIATNEQQTAMSFHQACYRYLGGGGGSSTNWALIIITVATFVTILLAFILYIWAQSFVCKPVIYLYTPEKRRENVRLRVIGEITTRIPYRRGVTSITWDDLTLEKGKIDTDGRSYDYLFYESKSVVPKLDDVGWTLARGDGRIYWDGKETTDQELKEKFEDILRSYGLYNNEIKDFIDYWFDDDMKILPEEGEFIYGIYPVSLLELERIFKLETDNVYPEYIRVQFFMKAVPEGTILKHPVYPEVRRSQYALHEWGVIFG